MAALIFGSNGQDGEYMRATLKRNGVDAIGVSRRNADIVGDIQDRDLVSSTVKEHQPDFIFHFAADSTTRHDALWNNHAAICTGSLNVLEAARRHSPTSRIFLSGSALQFENHGKPIDESAAFSANSPYAVSRIHSVYAARYFRSLGVNAYVGYFFNHDSPRRQARHIAAKIAHYCRHFATQREKLKIGDVSVRKEWTYAGDVVEAIWTLVNQDQIFECVIGSGEDHSIAEWLEACFSIIGEDWRSHVITDTNFKPDYRSLVSNPKLIKSLGWTPSVSLQELANMMIKDS
ncbi:MAG: GDP-mannose 4,6-dehydratase [Verrucomicrobiia bacterium]